MVGPEGPGAALRTAVQVGEPTVRRQRADCRQADCRNCTVRLLRCTLPALPLRSLRPLAHLARDEGIDMCRWIVRADSLGC